MDIEYLLWLQNFREGLPEIVSQMFVWISELPVGIIGNVLPAIFFWCISKQAGVFLMMNFTFGYFWNQVVKNAVCAYRPWIRDSRVLPVADAVPGATGYSFPSGHSQIGTAEYGGLAFWYRKNKLISVLCIVMVILIGFSRNYLGVHTPQDVIVAILLCCLVMFINYKVMRLLDKDPGKDIVVLIGGLLICALMLVYVEFKPYPLDYVDGILLVDPEVMAVDCYKAAGALAGFVIGWFIEQRVIGFTIPEDLAQRLLRLAFGLIGAAVMQAFLFPVFDSSFNEKWAELLGGLCGFLYFTAVYPLIFTTVEKAVKRRSASTQD